MVARGLFGVTPQPVVPVVQVVPVVPMLVVQCVVSARCPAWSLSFV